jgi:ribonucleoside-diphosphate reductase alpha chain
VSAKEIEGVDTTDPTQYLWREWPDANGYVRDEAGLVLCRVYKTTEEDLQDEVFHSEAYGTVPTYGKS